MQTSMEEIQQQARECDLAKVRQAERMTPGEKIRAGAELFEDACSWTMAGIRNAHPQWDDLQCQAELRRRVRL